MLARMGADVVAPRRGNVMPAAMLRVASDHRLIEEVHAGSERAFEVLFNRHQRPVLAFCHYMLGCREEAEDALQQTFLTAYGEITRGERPRSLRPWLYTIARNRCLSALRGRRRRSLGDVPERGADNLLTEVTTREELRAILADVARLPDDQRAALVLAELGDTSHAEIARIVGCPQAKVKALVFQARSSLSAERTARELSCAEVQQQLATLRGGALRRGVLRRHLHDCPGCRAFRDEIRAQRRRLGVLLPGAPFLALKRAVLGTLFGSGGGAAGGAALTAGTLSGAGLAATALVALAVPGGPRATGGTASRDGREPVRPVASATMPAPRAAPASAWASRVGTERAASELVREGRRASTPRRAGTQLAEPSGRARVNVDDARPATTEQPAAPDRGDRADRADRAEPTRPSEAPAGDGRAKPARHGNLPAPSQANRPVTPVKPARPDPQPSPAKPPQAHGELAPGKPPETPPPNPGGQNQTPPAAAPESAPTPPQSAQPSPGNAPPQGATGRAGDGPGVSPSGPRP
jgi:RNA polymerase sigma factor (sigma-70 family)